VLHSSQLNFQTEERRPNLPLAEAVDPNSLWFIEAAPVVKKCTAVRLAGRLSRLSLKTETKFSINNGK
jgi:hypothetical protein